MKSPSPRTSAYPQYCAEDKLSHIPTPGEVAGGPGNALGAGPARAWAVLGRWVVRGPLRRVSSPPPNGHRATTAPRPRRPAATNHTKRGHRRS